MEKLELKHLSPYLPYGLQIANKSLKGNIINTYTMQVENYGNQGLLNAINGVNQIPILRPLSDFDKIENELDLSTDFESSYYYIGNHVVFINTSDKTYLSDILTVNEWMFKNHFDVFGLIDAGLAIDINTVSNDRH